MIKTLLYSISSCKTITSITLLLFISSSLCAQQRDRQTEKKKALEECQRAQMSNTRFDCECVVGQYDAMVDKMARENNPNQEVDLALLKKRQSSIEKYCAQGRNIFLKQSGQGKSKYLMLRPVTGNVSGTTPACDILNLLKAGKSISPPNKGFAEPDHSQVLFHLYKEADCRPKEQLYDTYYKKAKSQYGLLKISPSIANVSEEEYCQCFAKNMAEAVGAGAQVGGPRYQKLTRDVSSKCNKP